MGKSTVSSTQSREPLSEEDLARIREGGYTWVRCYEEEAGGKQVRLAVSRFIRAAIPHLEEIANALERSSTATA